jgi:hypothetical protein
MQRQGRVARDDVMDVLQVPVPRPCAHLQVNADARLRLLPIKRTLTLCCHQPCLSSSSAMPPFPLSPAMYTYPPPLCNSSLSYPRPATYLHVCAESKAAAVASWPSVSRDGIHCFSACAVINSSSLNVYSQCLIVFIILSFALMIDCSSFLTEK